MTIAVTVAAAAWEQLSATARAADDGLETGGILLGYDLDGLVHVSEAGGPGSGAIRAPHRFHRDLDHAQRLADDAWRRDRSQWIGEWHTHPRSEPAPSGIDLDSYLRHLKDPDLRFDVFISIIVGVVSDHRTVAAWAVTGDAATVVPLTIQGAS